MDGVLIDTVEIGLRARKKLLSQRGIDLDSIPDPQGEGHRASSMKNLLATVKEHTGVQIDHDEFAVLKSHGITCAVASSSLREGVASKLDILGIQQYFSVIVTGSDVQEHKPHPAPYLYALKQLHLSPEDCVIFEDSLTGIEAGRAAGCKVIGFTQYNPPKELLQGVAGVVKSWSEIDYDKLEHMVADR